MQDQIKNLPKKYFQITDENKRDRMVAYVRLDEVLGIIEEYAKIFDSFYKMNFDEFHNNALKNVHNKQRK